MKIAMVAATAVLLAGCTVGIKKGVPGYPTDTFTVPITYQEAHRRAEAQPRECQQLPDMVVTGAVYTDNQTAVVRLNGAGSGLPLEEVEIEAIGPKQARITITVWGVGLWDKHEIAAMRQSIETGTPFCRPYQKRE